MTLPLIPTMDAFGSFLVAWLLVLGLMVRTRLVPDNWRGNALSAVAAAGLLLVPINGVPVWGWVFAYFPNPCLPLVGLLLARRAPRFAGWTLLTPPDRSAIWWFGAMAGTAVYVPALLGSPVDVYYWGWDADHASWIMAGAAILLLMAGNRLGVLLLAALMAFAVSGLESSNCWDYVIDPVYWLASLLVLMRMGIARSLGRARRAAVPMRIESPEPVGLTASGVEPQ